MERDLRRALQTWLDTVHAQEGKGRGRLLREAVKVLACKLHQERALPSKPLAQALPEVCLALRQAHPALFPEEGFALSPEALARLVEALEGLRLTEASGVALGEAFQLLLAKESRGEFGAFFTPLPILRLAVALLDPKPGEEAADPAAGIGSFLAEAKRWVEEKEGGSLGRALAVEIDPDTALLARVSLALSGLDGAEVWVGNGLAFASEQEGCFDLAFANPPFGKKISPGEGAWVWDYALVKAKGSPLPPEVLFLEALHRLLRPGGRGAAVVPDGLLNNPSYAFVRKWLAEAAEVQATVSLPTETFGPYGTTVKTSLLLFRKVPPRGRRVFFAVAKGVGYDASGREAANDLEAIALAWKGEAPPFPAGGRASFAPPPPPGERLDAEFHTTSRDWTLPWPSVPLGSVAEVCPGMGRKRLLETLPPKVRYLEIGDLHPSLPVVLGGRWMPKDSLPSRAAHLLCAGDILLAVVNKVGGREGPVALVGPRHEGAVATNGFVVLRPKEGLDPYYLLWLLRQKDAGEKLGSLLRGHVMRTVRAEDLRLFPIPLPPIEEQRYLGKPYRQALAHLERALELLEEESLQLVAPSLGSSWPSVE